MNGEIRAPAEKVRRARMQRTCAYKDARTAQVRMRSRSRVQAAPSANRPARIRCTMWLRGNVEGGMVVNVQGVVCR